MMDTSNNDNLETLQHIEKDLAAQIASLDTQRREIHNRIAALRLKVAPGQRVRVQGKNDVYLLVSITNGHSDYPVLFGRRIRNDGHPERRVRQLFLGRADQLEKVDEA